MLFPDLTATFWQDLQVLVQAVIAMILGGIVGWEREAAGKWAGLRTHMLVCVSAMLFVRLGEFLIDSYEAGVGGGTLRADPVRIIEAIVTGIAFLGAGTIFRDIDQVRMRGLTTAASLLATGTIGIAVALDRHTLAVGTTLLALVVLRLVQAVERKALPVSGRHR